MKSRRVFTVRGTPDYVPDAKCDDAQIQGQIHRGSQADAKAQAGETDCIKLRSFTGFVSHSLCCVGRDSFDDLNTHARASLSRSLDIKFTSKLHKG